MQAALDADHWIQLSGSTAKTPRQYCIGDLGATCIMQERRGAQLQLWCTGVMLGFIFPLG